MKLRPNAIRDLLDECICSGLKSGYARAHKHSDRPSLEHLEECQNHAIWLEIDQWFDFEPDETRL